MITVENRMIAYRAGHRFALEHPFADGATALRWAARFPTKAEAHVFMTAWHEEANLPIPQDSLNVA